MTGLTRAELDRFDRDGYLVVEAVLGPEELVDLWWDALDRIADGVVPVDFNSRWAVNAAQPICA